MEFENLERVLKEYGEEVAQFYKKKLISDNKKATGDLINSVKSQIEIAGEKYIVELELADYWKYVESGAKPHWPPVNKIIKWIKDKPIIPREVKGIKPTTEQLAFLIGRKISRDGIKGGLQLSETVAELNSKWMPIIEDAITKDILKDLEEIIIR